MMKGTTEGFVDERGARVSVASDTWVEGEGSQVEGPTWSARSIRCEGRIFPKPISIFPQTCSIWVW